MGGSLILGFFDGVHIAHRAVINSALEYCADNSTLITFKESPASYFGADKEYILSRDESIKRIKNLGVKNIQVCNFSEYMHMNADEYLKYIINKFSPDAIFTGFNHTFGINRTGNSDFLEQNQNKYNYKYFCIPPQKSENKVVSSTLIKEYLKSGNITKANELLSENFILEGEVITGAKIGRSIGFPTANIKYPNNIAKIPYGVYKVVFEGKPSILNWGMRPTVHNTKEPVAEIHILDFDGDLYGQNIRIEIQKKIRDEKHFSNLDELKSQIKKDIIECTEL